MNNKNDFNSWFETFLSEKRIPAKAFEIVKDDVTHFIGNDVVIELIKSAPEEEKKEIKNILVKLDFCNGDINHFLEHLASGYISIHY